MTSNISFAKVTYVIATSQQNNIPNINTPTKSQYKATIKQINKNQSSL